MEFEFLVEGNEFSFDSTSMTRINDDGCSETTNDSNSENDSTINRTVLIIIIIIIVIILVICLFCVFIKYKKDRKHDLKRVEIH